MLKKNKILNDNLDELEKAIYNYKKYNINTNSLKEEIFKILSIYKNKMLFENYSLLKVGHSGIIFYGYSKKYTKNLVIKIMPKFLNIFEIECNAYKSLSHQYMCPIYEIDNKNNVIVMEKLDNKEFDYKEDKIELEKFFDNVYSNLKPCNSIFQIHYIEMLNRKFNELDELQSSGIKFFYRKALARYKKNFNDEDLFLIHANLNSKNILKNSHKYYAISPKGYIAPKDFLFVRFIITELFLSDNIKEYFVELIKFISKYSEYKKLINALYIDSIFFLETILLRVKDYEINIKKAFNIINMIDKNIEEFETSNDEINDYNIIDINQYVFTN